MPPHWACWPEPKSICGLAGGAVPTVQSSITTATSAVYSTTDRLRSRWTFPGRTRCRFENTIHRELEYLLPAWPRITVRSLSTRAIPTQRTRQSPEQLKLSLRQCRQRCSHPFLQDQGTGSIAKFFLDPPAHLLCADRQNSI